MDQPFTLKEYWAFIKCYKKTIISTILITAVLFIGFITVRVFFTDETQINQTVQEQEIEEPTIDEEQGTKYLNSDYESLNENQQAELIQYLNQDAYLFRYYIENEEAVPYTSFRTIKEILTTDDIVQQIEDETSVEFLPDSKRAIRLDYDADNYIHTFLVGMGDKKGNQKLAQEYYNTFKEESLPFFENKRVHLIDAAPIKFEDQEAEETIVPEITVEKQNQGINVVLFILATVMAAITGVIISFFQNYFKKEISYLYNYQLINEERLVKINQLKADNKDTEISIINHVVRDSSKGTMIVASEEIPAEYMNNLENGNNSEKKVTISSNILTIPSNIDIQKIYIITALNKTNKNWYKQQLKLARNYSDRLTIIEID
ncbi:hypothetical protein SAMN05878443_1899 [Carnobacterium alterfunditum]|uniref:Uncharacterized protein n=1 Tax=Carnobacterium alterfunditum TaxID=28230 RepID=A0A1N6HJN5_9LACT|nr:hypothetical protein [Carnobacterium alterfunditum]SIO19947.1 hypothetical protein SAMN05878443_1899 [Carnobacterium alterfunditum]